MDVVLSKSASAAATTAASASAQVWRATVDKNAVSYEWGQQGGKMQKKLCVYDVGKQKRSADEQATFEALSNARKKIRMGYTVVRGPPELTAATDAYTSPKPMLALPFDEYIERVAHKQHPARYFVQPKLDGIRCLAHLPSGKLYSRGRKPILGCEHIEAALRQLPLNADTQEMCEIWLDGELYRHGLTFQTITSMARKNVNLSSESAALQYHIYDLVAPDVPFRERTERLRAIVNTSHDVAVSGADAAAAMASGADAGVTVAGVQPLVLVKTEAVASVDDIRAVHLDMTVRLHYEGTMVRADVATGYEVDKRSQSLLKVKDSDRKEFRTVRLERQEHDETLGAVWCVTPDGIEFKATPAMTDDEKRDIWAHRGQYGNMWGSVQHFGYTDKGAPRHAHIFGFRSADDMGVEAAAAVDGAADKDTKTGGV